MKASKSMNEQPLQDHLIGLSDVQQSFLLRGRGAPISVVTDRLTATATATREILGYRLGLGKWSIPDTKI